MRTIYVLLVAALVAVGMAACSKDDKGVNNTDNGVGGVVLSFGLGKGTKAAVTPSTAKPTTTWKDNIKDLLILFVEDGRVKDARDIVPVPTSNDMDIKNVVFTNIKASADNKNYEVYVIANSQQADHIKAEKTNGNTWDVSTCVGSSITDLLMKLVVNPDFVRRGESEKDAVGYKAAAEIFVARQTNITILPDENNEITTPFRLERAISLMRVRINQSLNGNQLVDFTGDNASLRIRRATTTVNPLKAFTRGTVNQVLFTKGGFRTTEPGSGYAGGTILNPGENITLWQDIRMLPGGSADQGGEKFDILLIGKAPAGYQPLGVDTRLAAPADVAWTAAVSTPVDPNFILEINLILERAGIWLDNPNDPGIPSPGKYGNAGVSIQLAPWGTIVSEDIPV